MSTPRQRLKSPRHYPIQPPIPPWSHKGQCHGHEWTIHIPFVACLSLLPFLGLCYLKIWPWNFKVKVMSVVKGQGHVVSPVFKLINFILALYQSDRLFLRYNFCEIWPRKIQGHGWGRRLWSHSLPGILLMHFLFVSRQLDQPFLIYDQ